ncbi:ABC transporter substrate-binding protein [Rubrimonas sp.]|uniref:ABC transporter substrate-binding protein n=1 Tax=Rubrimonas sp. TaxID=2036015 RepID=UPI002FDE6E71
MARRTEPPRRRAFGAIAAFCALWLGLAPAQAAPARVVSMNLCADQLAMLLAAPGQLVGVSDWAARPEASNMAEQARAYPLNSGSAEQVFLARPDLVLAGAFSDPVTVAMLRRLGLEVALLPAASGFADIPVLIREIGRLLGRAAQAEALVAEFETGLAALAAQARDLPRQAGAYHYPNNYTSGAGTLAHDAMDAAGLDNATAALGLTSTAQIELEALVMARPFLIRTRAISQGRHGRAYESAAHPALRALDAKGGAVVEERWQVCGAPFVLEAVAALLAARGAQ